MTPNPGFLGGLGSLFGGGTKPEEQQRAAIFQAGLAALASSQQSGATLGGSLFSGFQAGAGALQQAQQNAFQSKQLKNREEREDRLEKAQLDQAKLAEQKAARESRESVGKNATSLAKGFTGPSAMGNFDLLKNTPEAQAVFQQYGIDPGSITTPEQVQALGQQLGQFGGLTSPVSEPKQNLQLRAITGPDGKPLLVREEDAVGKQAYYQPDRRGLAVTLPDGTTISDGPSAVQPGELTRATTNKLQETIVNAQDKLDRLNATAATYKPEYLQARGFLKAGATKLIDKLGGDVSPEDRKFFDDYTEFRANAQRDINSTIKELAGSAVTGNELQRTQKEAPNDNDSPIEFESKLRAQAKFVKRAILRSNYALKNGIGTKSVDELSKLIPLEAVDAIYESRVNDIFEQLGGTDEVRAEAIKRANQEFGLAR